MHTNVVKVIEQIRGLKLPFPTLSLVLDPHNFENLIIILFVLSLTLGPDNSKEPLKCSRWTGSYVNRFRRRMRMQGIFC